jgi:hypothetical protein
MSEQEPTPQEPDSEIVLSSEYDKESDALHVGAKVKVRSLLDTYSRMNLVDMVFRALVEKIAQDFFDNWSEEIYEQMDTGDLMEMVKAEIVKRMADRMDTTLAQVIARSKDGGEDGGVQARGSVCGDEVPGLRDRECGDDLEQP